MKECDRQILDIFASRIRQHFPNARIWAFGSRARGDAGKDSDLDICVVVPQLDTNTSELISYIAWDIGFEHEIFISTIKYSQEQFERGPCSVSPIVKSILREGILA